MFQTLMVALPVFGFVAGGYILGKTPLFDAERAKGVTNYVFWFAVPMLLFRAGAKLAGGEAAAFDPKVLIAYFVASATIYLLAMLANALIFNGKGAEPPLAGMTAGYSNSVMMGIPLSELFFGADGLAIATAIIAMSAILYYGATTLFIELRLHKSASIGGIVKETALGLVRTPVILAMGAGVLFGAAGLHLLRRLRLLDLVRPLELLWTVVVHECHPLSLLSLLLVLLPSLHRPELLLVCKLLRALSDVAVLAAGSPRIERRELLLSFAHAASRARRHESPASARR